MNYANDKGLLMCGKCYTQKQHKTRYGIMPVMCDCERRALEDERAEQAKAAFKRRVKRLRRDGLTDDAYQGWTFEKDDRRNLGVSEVCRKYVDEWEDMKARNIGAIFYGNPGTGKTFYACCIANALFEQCVPVLVTSFPRILNKLQSFDDKNLTIDNIQRYDLVVFDDLSAERRTDYAVEQLFQVIDTRYRNNKPIIITTNLTPKEIKEPQDMALRRVYDRIVEMCVLPVKMVGPSRRPEIAKAKWER